MLTHPRWCDHFVLITCKNQYGYHNGYLVIKVMMWGWCTMHYWLDYPSSEKIREAVESAKDFDLDRTEIIPVGDCLYCQGKLEGKNNVRLRFTPSA